MHASLTEKHILAAAKSNMLRDTFIGFCTTCGRKAKQNCEPDAREYPCQFKSCGALTVYGADELMFMTVA